MSRHPLDYLKRPAVHIIHLIIGGLMGLIAGENTDPRYSWCWFDVIAGALFWEVFMVVAVLLVWWDSRP